MAALSSYYVLSPNDLLDLWGATTHMRAMEQAEKELMSVTSPAYTWEQLLEPRIETRYVVRILDVLTKECTIRHSSVSPSGDRY